MVRVWRRMLRGEGRENCERGESRRMVRGGGG